MTSEYILSLRLGLLATLGVTFASACGGNTTGAGSEETPGGSGGASGAPSGGLNSETAGGGTGATAGADGGSVGFGAMGGSATGGTATGGAATGGTAVGGMAVGGMATMGPPYPSRTCTPTADSDPNGAFVQCQEGLVHRRAPEVCSYTPMDLDLSMYPEGVPAECKSDRDCTEKEFGYCHYAYRQLRCDYGCERDEDCGPGAVCHCGPNVGICRPAECAKDADCNGKRCLGLWDPPCLGAVDGDQVTIRFSCEREIDECLGDAECASGNCEKHPESNRCGPRVVCGRPFLVGGVPRLATARARDGSSLPAGPREDGALGVDARRALARHWTSLGLMEHASVAAFARFTLELLAFGAPPALLREAQRAMGDEIAHTELCFSIAARYAGRAIEASPLPIAGALDDTSLERSLVTAFLEACVGETVAAVEARLAASGARDADIRAALERIAEDESRHAELGWRFLKWGLERCADEERRRLCAELRRLLDRELASGADATSEDDVGMPELAAYGVPSVAERQSARRAALEGVVVPCAEALGIAA